MNHGSTLPKRKSQTRSPGLAVEARPPPSHSGRTIEVNHSTLQWEYLGFRGGCCGVSSVTRRELVEQ